MQGIRPSKIHLKMSVSHVMCRQILAEQKLKGNPAPLRMLTETTGVYLESEFEEWMKKTFPVVEQKAS